MRKLYIIALPRERETKVVDQWDMRFLHVDVFLGSRFPCLYYIFENEAGVLMWERVWEEEAEHADAMAFVLPKSGYYASEPVYPEEAEIITGLCEPVCMDRLRELVHES